MNEEIYTRPKYRNRFIVPVFSIAFFLIAVMSVSFGYFTWCGSVSASTSTATGSYPGRCSLTTSTNSSTIEITRNMLLPRQIESQAISVKNVAASIFLNGPTTCKCDYTVKVRAYGDTYIPSGTANDMTYKVTGSTGAASPNTVSGATAETRLDSCGTGTGSLAPGAAGCTVGSGTIQSAGAGGALHIWYLETRFYYINYANQINLQGRHFWYALQYSITSCTF